ncbi:MAG: SPOR domain-containing protein [Gammaproteobacteria bacterium]|nr:SPOR domain-containing protein [Gammaproteobacteria bacterium]
MEQQLKQRLVGAVVLVSLAVIFIPVILEGPDDEWSPRDHSIPEPPRVDYRAAMELPLPEVEPEEGVAPAAVVEPPRPETEPSTILRPPPVKPLVKPVPAAAPAVQPTPDGGKLKPGWYVQVGSFSQPANARGLRDSLTKAGFNAHLQQVASAKGTSYRVLLGSESSRELAEQLLGKLEKPLSKTGIVIGIGVPEQ